MSILWIFRARSVRGQVGAFALGFILVMLTLVLRMYLSPHVEAASLIFFVPAILLTSAVGGLGAGLFATLLSCFFAAYFVLPPLYSVRVDSPFALMTMSVLALTGLFIASICELLRKTIRLSETANAELVQAHRAADQLAAIVEGSSDAIIGKNLEGFITSWNKASAATFGYSSAEAIGSHISSLIPPSLLAEEEGVLAKIASGHAVKHFETRRLRKDGSTVDVSVTVSPVRDARGIIIGASTTMRDISERKRAEQTLAESESQFHTLANAIPQLCWMANADGGIFWYNDRWYQYTGTTPHEMEGWGWQSVHDPEVLPQVLERWRASIATGQPFEMVFPLRGADGAFRPHLTRVTPVVDRDGKVSRWFGTNTDITEQKRGEEEVRHSRAKLEAALRCMSDAVFITDADGNFVHINEAFATFHRFPNTQDCLTTLKEYPDLFEAFAANGRSIPFEEWPICRALRGEAGLAEITLRRKDIGESWNASINFAPIIDPQGAITGAVLTERDVTALKENEARLEAMRGALSRAGRMNELGQISAGLAHELNQPLAAMLNYSNVAKRLIANGEPASFLKASDAIAKASDQAFRAGEIIRRMRAFVEKREMNCAAENINAILENAIAIGLTGVPAGSITIHREFAPDTPPVFADHLQIQQVLVNLLRNAVEAMAESPRREITISTATVEDAAVEISVRDTGPGIPLELADSLFMPFITNKPSGMGIGLVISQSIVEAHGGRIQAESNRGGGARFHFKLPSAPMARAAV